MPLPALACQVLRGRWLALLAANLVMAAAAGGGAVFPIYSNSMITSPLGYDHKTINTLAFFKNLGASLGVLPGVINEVAPTWVVLVLGAGMNLVGYLMMYLAASGRTARPPTWLMYVYTAVASNSQSFASTGALVATVNNFPDHRGLVLGLLMGSSGLSGAVFTQIHRAFYGGTGDNGAAFLALLAVLPTAISLLFTFSIRTILPRGAAYSGRSQERKGVLAFVGISAVAGMFLIGLNAVELKVPEFGRPSHYATTIISILVILFSAPLAVVVMQELQTVAAPTTTTTSSAATTTPPTPASVASSNNPPPSFFMDAFSRPRERGQDYTILQGLFSMDMLLLFVATACGVGGMLTATDNIGLIVQALGYPQRATSTLVSLASLSNYAGRVVAGLGSDYLVERCKLPRPLALTVALLLACVGHMFIALGVVRNGGLYSASLIIGFCFGAQWTLLFTVISEVFGLAHFSTLYNFAAAGSPVGSYILNVLVTGHLYAREAQRQQNLTCTGVQCFKVSFLIIAGVTLLGAAVSAVLAWRTAEFYHERIPMGAAAVASAVTSDSSTESEV